MATEMLTEIDTAAPVFPAAETKRRLQVELQKIADQGSLLRPEWEPLLDSKRVVGIVLALEDLFPFKIPPDKVVRKGGYDSVEEAKNDMFEQIKKIWIERSNPKVRK
jgi:acyl carrier protein